MPQNIKDMLLETERLFLRQLTWDDFDDMCRLDADPEVMRFITHGVPRTKEEVRSRLKVIIDRYEENKELGIWAVCLKSGEFIGWGELYYLEDSGLVEVGYRLKRDQWNKGYATEIAKALVDYGLHSLGLKKIVGVTYPENIASKRVLSKAGLKEEGIRFFYETDLSYFEIERSD